MEEITALHRFVPDAPDTVFAKFHRHAVDTFRYRLTRGETYYRLVTGAPIVLDRVREIVDDRQFQPKALLLSHHPTLGIELEVDGEDVQLFCTSAGSNDALVTIMNLKQGLPDVWNQFFLPFLARA